MVKRVGKRIKTKRRKKTKVKKSMKGGGIVKEITYSLDEQISLLDKIKDTGLYNKELRAFTQNENKSFLEFLCEINCLNNSKWLPSKASQDLKIDINEFLKSTDPTTGIILPPNEEIERQISKIDQNKYNVDNWVELFKIMTGKKIDEDAKLENPEIQRRDHGYKLTIATSSQNMMKFRIEHSSMHQGRQRRRPKIPGQQGRNLFEEYYNTQMQEEHNHNSDHVKSFYKILWDHNVLLVTGLVDDEYYSDLNNLKSILMDLLISENGGKEKAQKFISIVVSIVDESQPSSITPEMGADLQKTLTITSVYMDMKDEMIKYVQNNHTFFTWEKEKLHDTNYSISCTPPQGKNIDIDCKLADSGIKCDEASKKKGCEERFRGLPDELIKLWNAVCDKYNKKHLKISAREIEEKFKKFTFNKKEESRKSPHITPQPPMHLSTLTSSPNGGSKMKHKRKHTKTKKKKKTKSFK